MQADIGAKRQRALAERRGESIVDEQPGAVPVGDLSYCCQIDDCHGRICRSLGISHHRLRMRTKCIFPILSLQLLQPDHLDAIPRSNFMQKSEGRAVERFLRDNGLPAANPRQNR